MLESNGIDIQYIPLKQLETVLMTLEKQQKTPLLLLQNSRPTQLKNTSKKLVITPLIQLNSGLQCIIDQTDKTHSSITENVCELWVADGNWQFDQYTLNSHQSIDSTLSFCHNDQYLIGGLCFFLSEEQTLQEGSYIAYQHIMNVISQQHRHLLRMWNYFPDINMNTDHGERYQQFCVGRYHAFANAIQYPAASAVGNYASMVSNTLVITFIATKTVGLFIENPTQISAYHYPKHYSPKSPSFARAAIYQPQLYISGTASIVGHKSVFKHDIVAQTKQIIKNLQHLITHSNHQQQTKQYTLSSCHSTKFDPLTEDKMTSKSCLSQQSLAGKKSAITLKIYLRYPEHIQQVAPIIHQWLPLCHNVCYLHADICRQELDIEIEMIIT
jgi:hypothetical protein